MKVNTMNDEWFVDKFIKISESLSTLVESQKNIDDRLRCLSEKHEADIDLIHKRIDKLQCEDTTNKIRMSLWNTLPKNIKVFIYILIAIATAVSSITGVILTSTHP